VLSPLLCGFEDAMTQQIEPVFAKQWHGGVEPCILLYGVVSCGGGSYQRRLNSSAPKEKDDHFQ
jgi:hypothetical protein